MKTHTYAPDYKGFRFPSEIISHAVWLYFRFALSYLDVEDCVARMRKKQDEHGVSFSLHVSCHSTYLGDPCNLSDNVSFVHSLHVSFAHHVHDLVSL